MIKIENIKVYNFDAAIVGMRNPLQSWGKNDSFITGNNRFILGANDKKLALNLVKAGGSHRKFTRQIFISMVISANTKWWQEFDTYEHTVTNSTSQMFTLLKKPFEISDFSNELFTESSKAFLDLTINRLNDLRDIYFETKDMKVWREIVELTPQSYMYKRNVTMNYEVFLAQYKQRKSHKLSEWREYSTTLRRELPYMDEFLEVLETK